MPANNESKKLGKTVATKSTASKSTVSKSTVSKSAAPKTKSEGSVKKTTKPVAKAATKSVAKSVAKKVTKKVVAKSQEGGDRKSVTRYFKIKSQEGECRGRFSGRKPKQAANKALTSILKNKTVQGDSTKGKMKFSIIECTRGSGCKQYNYVGERIKLRKPMTVKIGDKKIVYNYSNNVSKAAAPKTKKVVESKKTD